MANSKAEKVYRQDINKGVAIILARGGSKGVKRKNVRKIGKLPLVAFSIKAALNCPYISSCYVSTEDEEIKKVSQKYGAEVIDRPLELAKDNTPSSDSLIHAVKYLKNKKIMTDWFVLLQPTSPFRTEKHLTESVEIFFDNDKKNVVSICKAEHHPFKCLIDNKSKLIPLKNYELFEAPRQLLPNAYKINGAIYINDTNTFLSREKVIEKDFIPYEMDYYNSIDIDTEFDLEFANFLYERIIRNEEKD